MTVTVDSVIYGQVPVGSVRPTSNETAALVQFFIKHGIVGDGPDGERNVEFVVDYFLTTWNGTEITEQNLTYAWEKIRDHLKLYSPAERAWYDAARQNVQLANDLANYVGSTSGRPGQLVKDGSDLHFENLLTLFKEISSRGESANPTTRKDIPAFFSKVSGYF